MLRAVAAGRGHGLRVTPSMSAGTYLCNYAYWRMLRALPPQTPCLFVHVPKLSGRRLAAAADALRAIALVLLSSAAFVPATADHPG